MKIALHHRGLEAKAEDELSKRLAIAAERIGHVARVCATSADVEAFAPDFVLAMHSDFPKLTEFKTFGCMWNPPQFFANTCKTVMNIVSYDVHLFGGQGIRRYVDDLNFGLRRSIRSGTIYPSCHATSFVRRDFSNATLAMVGTNWDGPRFHALVTKLAESGRVNFFGPRGAWDHVGSAYAGSVPFDGESVLRQLHACGITLALHRPEHLRVGAPNMRVFEGVAASSALICDENPFVREGFGDSVFYVDRDLPPDCLAEQILDHVATIRTRPDRAADMAKSAHDTFLRSYSLERLLTDVCELAETLRTPKPAASRIRWGARPSIDCIVRTGLRDPRFLRRALRSLADQTARADLRVIVVNNGGQKAVRDVVADFAGDLKFTEVVVARPKNRSDSLWRGLAEVRSEYFCILDDDDRLHAGHIEGLRSLLEREGDAVAAYSGAVRVEEGVDPEGIHEKKRETRSLAYFEPFDPAALFQGNNFITSNSFLARSSALDAEVLVDPDLEAVEDLWLLICLARKGRFVESWEVTSEFYWRRSQVDNLSFDASPFHEGLDRIRTRLQFMRLQTAGPRITDPFRFDSDAAWRAGRPVPRSVDFVDGEPVPPREGAEEEGFVDSVRSFDDFTEIVGWADWRKTDRLQRLVVSGAGEAELLLLEPMARPDVARAKRDWSYHDCGFRLRFRILRKLEGRRLALFSIDREGRAVRLGGGDRLASILLHPVE